MTIPSEVIRARQHAVGDLLRRTSRRVPDKIAIIDGPVRLTYCEFNEAVNRVAHSLADRGLGPGDRVLLLSRNCWQFAVITFAAAKLGAILVPVNFMLREPEIAFIIDHAEPSVVIAQDGLRALLSGALAQVTTARPSIRGWFDDGSGRVPDGFQDVAGWTGHACSDEPATLVADDDPIRLMYTSGTESRPKGALLSSKSLIAQYMSCIVDGQMSGEDVEVHALPMYHCAQLDCFFGPDVYLGATNVILPAPEPAALLQALEREQATKFFAPPTVWISLLRDPHFDQTDLSSLRKGYYGASAMPVEVLREIQRRLPDLRLWNFYGQTEMAPVATILPPEEQSSHPGSAGRAVLNVETAVVDDLGHPLPPGEIGEIVHRSPQATLGYYRDPERTAEAFRDGWFHSGDLGVLDGDGRLTVVDRKKDMIKTGGENVASREVEEAIYELDAVAEVAVFGIPHPRWIEAVVAVVVPREGATLHEQAVINHCRSRLAGFKSPKYVRLTTALPKNPSGKILKRDLRLAHEDLAQEGTP
jgi:fatty-acyl-CoA synthase